MCTLGALAHAASKACQILVIVRLLADDTCAQDAELWKVLHHVHFLGHSKWCITTPAAMCLHCATGGQCLGSAWQATCCLCIVWRCDTSAAAAAFFPCCVVRATRDVEPTALLLRSGDVVVMAEEARACYHGIPRVLTDRPLPQELMQAAEQHDGQVFTPYIHHMQGCRINISMRAT